MNYLEYYKEILSKKDGYKLKETEKTSEIAPYHGNFEKNATVARIISEFRKTINAINKEYGVIDEIHIEMATDVANSKDKIARIRNGQLKYKEQRDSARARCLENGVDPDVGDNLLRFRLAEEQDFKCIYTGKQIYLGSKTPANAINIVDCDIDQLRRLSSGLNPERRFFNAHAAVFNHSGNPLFVQLVFPLLRRHIVINGIMAWLCQIKHISRNFPHIFVNGLFFIYCR